MAQIVVDSTVMRDKAKTLAESANNFNRLYTEMDAVVNKVNSRMKGSTIEDAVNEFKSMKQRFDTMYDDVNKFSNHS